MEKEIMTSTFNMAQLTIWLVLVPTTVIALNSTVNICHGSTSCGECITRDPNCAWCSDVDYDGTRCGNITHLLNSTCEEVEQPKGWLIIVQNETLTDANDSPDGTAIQVSPQLINVTLKVGEPQTVRLNIRLANDYPLDLYYLTDLSKSLSDDINNLKILGLNLIRALQERTDSLQLGLGAFVDKVSTPFVIVDPNTCTTGSHATCCPDCAAPFSFRNELSLTNDTSLFSDRLKVLKYSTSIDTPEGGLDALVQVISCQDIIGWRKGARRMIVLATDAGFHMAGDGRMAGISNPNDGLCHIEAGSNEYLKSSDSDYPSVGQISALLKENNIFSVFAVDDNERELYMEMTETIKGAFVGVLAADSSNIVRLIVTAYEIITSNVDVDDTAPGNIDVSYTSLCAGEEPMPGMQQCNNVQLGETFSFDVEITARECPANGENQIFQIRPVGFDESLTIMAYFICNCDCEKNTIKDPTQCSNGNGTLTCGLCVCDDGRYGQDCECDAEFVSDQDFSSCIAPNSTLVCHGRGDCVCGECVCQKPTNEKGVFSGKYCECDNFTCARYQGVPCGGEERGECVCGECQCKSDYVGDGCNCFNSTKACQTPSGLLCNGFGECKCGRCICNADSPFQGPTCEDCLNCVGTCSSFRECVLCKVFGQGSFDDKQCDMCSVTIETVDVININDTETVLCQYLDSDNCTIFYTYDVMTDTSAYIVYVQELKVCRQFVETSGSISIDLKWLIIGIIMGILLIGLLILALIKLCLYLEDRREVARFKKELASKKWTGNDNPLFQSSTTTFTNPQYGK